MQCLPICVSTQFINFYHILMYSKGEYPTNNNKRLYYTNIFSSLINEVKAVGLLSLLSFFRNILFMSL